MPKQLTITEMKRFSLIIVPEDKTRDPKADAVKDQGERYVLCNGKMLLRLHHKMIGDKVWKYVESDEYERGPEWENGKVKDRLERIMPVWLAVLCPQAGGLLKPVELEESSGILMSKKARQSMFLYNNVPHFIPAMQVEFVRKFYSEVCLYVGPMLEGRDLFGDKHEIASPVVCRVKGVGPVGLIMPMWYKIREAD